MKRTIHRLAAATAVYSFLAILGGQRSIAESNPTNAAVDNTKMNQGDQNAGAVTADHAKQNVSDRDLMSQIRKSVIQDQDLSTYAHNVKIVARNGVVTLKGPVKTTEEKQTVVAKAVAVAGADNVKDQMTVKEKSH